MEGIEGKVMTMSNPKISKKHPTHTKEKLRYSQVN